ncbi:TPA: ribbon-helix-helix protein, CopG family [Legionella pneumophila]|nr:ribbon-helix-helix protein, CopG family [Legionella pneumophila]HAU1200841.1 ribbon-helix-helix protein, CopG family [Legionella pneumophila]HAU1874387.1 ribbon-helix-helix protein, CopG family [Legionella pneumophila]HBD7079386.1 ribbon-helix-helix protein, CopG family [Legionella pneumophila]HCC0692340.1 ribbon-helix-helix protein, CopG family [Legionella pneumophila]
MTKTSTLTFRISPELKEALRTAAEREHRSVTNMIEVLIRNHCIHNEGTIVGKEVLINPSKNLLED